MARDILWNGKGSVSEYALKLTGCSSMLKHEQFLKVVEAGWNIQIDGCKMFQVVRKMKMLKRELRKLNTQSFRNIVSEANEDRTALQNTQEQLHLDPDNLELQQTGREKYQKLRKSSYLAEIYLKLKQAITQLNDAAGCMQTEQKNIAKIVVQYYEDLLGKTCEERVNTFRGFLNNGPLLTIDQLLRILEPFTIEEVKKAVFSIDINKSPGPDSYGSGFYRAAWRVISKDITEAVLEFFQTGQLLKQINATNISLIPK
uniref:Uncharacterized protein n=3 Tax=Nicotiana TaxID=4085 RepID=A0A1S4C366_TOBAC